MAESSRGAESKLRAPIFWEEARNCRDPASAPDPVGGEVVRSCFGSSATRMPPAFALTSAAKSVY